MAGRIRTIKPEVLTDAKAVGLSDMAWRLWVSTWLLADDEGRFPADDIILVGQIFPGRNSRSVHGALTEASNKGFVTLYTVKGQRFGVINGWNRHQKINRPSGPKYPAPCEGFSEDSVSPHGGLRADHDHDHDHDHDQQAEPARVTPKGSSGVTAKKELARFLDWFNDKNKRKFQPRKTAVDFVEKLLKEGYTQEDMRLVAEHRRILWADDPEMKKNFTPNCFLRFSNFERYIDEAKEVWDKQEGTGGMEIPTGPVFDLSKVLGEGKKK